MSDRFMDAFPDLPDEPSDDRKEEILKMILGMYANISGLSDSTLWRVVEAGPKALRRATERGLAAEGITEDLLGKEVYGRAMDEMSFRLTGMIEAITMHRHLKHPPKESDTHDES